MLPVGGNGPGGAKRRQQRRGPPAGSPEHGPSPQPALDGRFGRHGCGDGRQGGIGAVPPLGQDETARVGQCGFRVGEVGVYQPGEQLHPRSLPDGAPDHQ